MAQQPMIEAIMTGIHESIIRYSFNTSIHDGAIRRLLIIDKISPKLTLIAMNIAFNLGMESQSMRIQATRQLETKVRVKQSKNKAVFCCFLYLGLINSSSCFLISESFCCLFSLFCLVRVYLHVTSCILSKLQFSIIYICWNFDIFSIY